MSVKTVLKGVWGVINKNSPVILTGVAVGGNIAGTIMAVKATPKAMNDISEAKRKKGAELTKAEVVKACWKNYIPSGITIFAANFCGVMATRTGLKRNAALASAAVLAENTMREYQDKVVQVVGENQEKAIRDDIVKDKINTAMSKLPEAPNGIPRLGEGHQLFFYVNHQLWFRSDVETVRRCIDEFNQALLGSAYGLDENELMWRMNLGSDGCGSMVGWNPNRALCKIEFVYTNSEDHMGYISPWGEGAIGVEFSPGHGPIIGYDSSGDVYCGD